MADSVWDLEPWEHGDDFDYSPYYKLLTEAGFVGMEDVERDLDDEKWLELD